MTQQQRLTWQQVRDRIQSLVLDNTYAPGDKLPRDEDIAAEMGCARSTVQRAMRNLSESGIVERRRKGGTHVRADPVTRATLDIPITRKEVEGRGAVYGYQLISQTMSMTPRSVTAQFGLTTPVKMMRVEAVHLSNQQPYIYEDRWICTDTVPDICSVDLKKESANEWLVRNKPYSKCEIRFYAQKARQHEAEVLDIEPGEALFVMERTTWINSSPITTVKALTMPGYQLFTQI